MNLWLEICEYLCGGFTNCINGCFISRYNTKVHAEMLFCMSNIMDDCLQSSFHGPIVNFLVHCNDCIVLVVVVVSYLNMQFIK